MTTEPIAHPPIVSQEEWLSDRKKFLVREKEATKYIDKLNADRRRLSMVKVEKDYTFEGPNGPVTFLEMFEGRTQLVIYHFMFAPEWENGCPGCTGWVDAVGDLSLLNERNTTFALISRAPIEKLNAYKEKRGWDLNWFSSFGSMFNYDFHTSLDEGFAPVLNNYRTREQLEEKFGKDEERMKGEKPATSVFFRIESDIYHAYSTFDRGSENLTHSYALLDITPYGRQEDWEDSPDGWPQKPTYG
jgi:predicted dithiol-disulfide oxidoreductase (DUF899 family)